MDTHDAHLRIAGARNVLRQLEDIACSIEARVLSLFPEYRRELLRTSTLVRWELLQVAFDASDTDVCNALSRVRSIGKFLRVSVMADVPTVEEIFGFRTRIAIHIVLRNFVTIEVKQFGTEPFSHFLAALDAQLSWQASPRCVNERPVQRLTQADLDASIRACQAQPQFIRNDRDANHSGCIDKSHQ